MAKVPMVAAAVLVLCTGAFAAQQSQQSGLLWSGPADEAAMNPTQTTAARLDVEPATEVADQDKQDPKPTAPPDKTGKISVLGQISYTMYDVDPDSISVLTLIAGVGYYLDQNHEIGGFLVTSLADAGGETTTIISFTAKYSYHLILDSPDWAPYGGGSLGFASFSNGADDSAFLVGIHVGVDYFLTTSAAVNFELGYNIIFFDDATGYLQLLIGFRFFFG